MGGALLKAWSYNLKYSFIVVDPNQYKKINKSYSKNIKVLKSFTEIKNFKSIEIIIFAVKPQQIELVLSDMTKYNFNKQAIFVSIVAGKKINFFNKFLPKYNKFVRVMPNMPAVINQGITCLVSNKNFTIKNKKQIDSLFLLVGETIWINKESDINKVTAISGSGPGYVFLFIDAFEKAAAKLGLKEKETKKLVHQTLLGSINLLLKNKKTASYLADIIAVKGGTTEAGLNKFKDKKVLHLTFEKVIKAAYMRANLIGK